MMDEVKRRTDPRVMAEALRRVLADIEIRIECEEENSGDHDLLLDLYKEKCAALVMVMDLGMELAAAVVGGVTQKEPGLLVMYGGRVVRAEELDLPDLAVVHAGMEHGDWRRAVVAHLIEEKDK